MNGIRFHLRTAGDSRITTPARVGAEGIGNWPGRLLSAFGGKRSQLRRAMRSVLLAAGAYVAVPVLDVAAYTLRNLPWAEELFTTSSVLFLVTVAMSAAALLAGQLWSGGSGGAPLHWRVPALLSCTALVVIVQLVLRFHPDDARVTLAVLAWDLLLLVLIVASGAVSAKSEDRHG